MPFLHHDTFLCRDQGGSARRIGCNLVNLNQVYEKYKNKNFSHSTFTTGFNICLYARYFDSSVCRHEIFGWHFADSSKLLKNHLIAENLNEVKSSSLKKLYILKPVVKVQEEKFTFLCFFSLPAIRHADFPWG